MNVEPLPLLCGVAIVLSLVAYALTGGADFGGGVWDLLAFGRDRARQRELIERAIGPIWEANHVWLIVVVVLLFAAFPPAFARLATLLHAPILLLLLAIVLRGVAFTFRHYDSRREPVRRRWGALFSAGSVAAPFLLGAIAGAVTAHDAKGFAGWTLAETAPLWLDGWAVANGAFVLATFAWLAAVYLCAEAELRDAASPTGAAVVAPLVPAFRRRATVAFIACAALAAVLLAASRSAAPLLHEGLTDRPWSLLLLGAVAAASGLAITAVRRGRYRLARLAAAGQVAGIVGGWGLAQFPWLVAGEHSLASAAAPEPVLRALLVVLAAGSLVVLPSLYVLFRIFKTQRIFKTEKVSKAPGP